MHPISVHPISSNTLKDSKALIDSNTMVVADFNTTLSPIGDPNKKIN
jgi:hypothetical protein